MMFMQFFSERDETKYATESSVESTIVHPAGCGLGTGRSHHLWEGGGANGDCPQYKMGSYHSHTAGWTWSIYNIRAFHCTTWTVFFWQCTESTFAS